MIVELYTFLWQRKHYTYIHVYTYVYILEKRFSLNKKKTEENWWPGVPHAWGCGWLFRLFSSCGLICLSRLFLASSCIFTGLLGLFGLFGLLFIYLESPKSTNFHALPSVSMFSGFTSRCNTPLSAQCLRYHGLLSEDYHKN